MIVWPLIIVGLFLLAGIRRIPAQTVGVKLRLGKRTKWVHRPGTVWIFPFIDRIQCIPAEPFSVSLPPQSAITQDEIPIQLQASLDARVTSPDLAASVRDWRIQIVSLLQNLMKDKLEELQFDQLDEVFPGWVKSIRAELAAQGREIGVEVTGLHISNLSPRTRPNP